MAVSKKKKRQFWVYGIVGIFLVLVVVLMWLFSWSGASFIIPSGSVATYTKDELADLYWDHKDQLEKVAAIVLASDAFRQRMIDNKDSDWGIRTESLKGDFSEEDWSAIVELSKKIRPYMIMRSLRGGDTVYFNFAPQKTKSQEISTSLYYITSSSTLRYYTHYETWVGLLEHLDGYWYIGERIREL